MHFCLPSLALALVLDADWHVLQSLKGYLAELTKANNALEIISIMHQSIMVSLSTERNVKGNMCTNSRNRPLYQAVQCISNCMQLDVHGLYNGMSVLHTPRLPSALVLMKLIVISILAVSDKLNRKSPQSFE